MSATLKVILTWAERIATVVLIAVPAIRSISSVSRMTDLPANSIPQNTG